MIKLKDLIFEKRGPCWKGYSQIGMKKKGNKMVPNCVKNEEKISEKKIKPMQKISKKEWSKIKKFNKHIGQDGTYYVMQLTNKGTALVPVVVEEKLTENEMTHITTKDTSKQKLLKLARMLPDLGLKNKVDYKLSSNGKILAINTKKIGLNQKKYFKKKLGIDLSEGKHD